MFDTGINVAEECVVAQLREITRLDNTLRNIATYFVQAIPKQMHDIAEPCVIDMGRSSLSAIAPCPKRQ